MGPQAIRDLLSSKDIQRLRSKIMDAGLALSGTSLLGDVSFNRRMSYYNSAGSSGSSAYPIGFIGGGSFRLQYVNNTTFTVNTGVCRDRLDATNMSLTSSVTVNLAAFAQINGMDRKTGPGTVSNTTVAVVGSGTTFLTDFGQYASTGTISTGGGSSAAIVGTGTSFTTQLAVGDLIGNAAVGYRKVIAITDDTHCTVSAVITINAGSSYFIAENATMRVNTYTCSKVSAIADNNNLTLETNPGTNGVGVAWYIGDLCPDTHVWNHLLSGASGTGVVASTQRTTPFLIPSGYTTSRRGIMTVYIDATGIISPFRVSDDGWMFLEVAVAAAPTVPVSNGTGATNTWVRYAASQMADARATALAGTLLRGGGSSMSVYWRQSGDPVSTASRNRKADLVTDGLGYPFHDWPCDTVGAFDLSQSGGTTGVYVYLTGYRPNMMLWM